MRRERCEEEDENERVTRGKRCFSSLSGMARANLEKQSGKMMKGKRRMRLRTNRRRHEKMLTMERDTRPVYNKAKSSYTVS